MGWKIALTIIGVGLAIGAPLPYIRDILRGETRPHVITWVIFSMIVTSAFIIQIIGKGGAGSFVLGATALMNFLVLGLSLRSSSRYQITRFDLLVLILAIIAFIPWLVSDSPQLSIVLQTLILLLGMVPTYRKSWRHPYQETPSIYQLAALKQVFGIAALSTYNLLTLLFPCVVLIANMGLGFLIVVRRRTVPLASQ